MLGRLAFAIAISFIVVGGLSAAHGAEQAQCNKRDAVTNMLGKKYGEAPEAAGVATNGNLLVMFTNSKTGSWSMVETTPQGMSCLRAAGDGWTKLAPSLEGPMT